MLLSSHFLSKIYFLAVWKNSVEISIWIFKTTAEIVALNTKLSFGRANLFEKIKRFLRIKRKNPKNQCINFMLCPKQEIGENNEK